MKRRSSRWLGLVTALATVAALAGGLVSFSEVTAQTPTVSVGSLATGVGLEGTVSLQALDIGAPGLSVWTIDIAYEPAVVSAVGCTAEQGSICNLAFAEDTLRVSGVSVFGLEGDTALATITFRCRSEGSSDLTLSVQTLADATLGAPQPIDAALAHGSVTCTTEPPATPPAAPPEPLGDVNCDSLVDSLDAALILQLDVGLIDSPSCLQHADASGDGRINSLDAALILQLDVGLIDSLPT